MSAAAELTFPELSDFEREILTAFAVVEDRGQWSCNRDGFAGANELAQVVAHGELRIDAWTRHVASRTGLDPDLPRDEILERWHRGLPWPRYEAIRDTFPWDEDANWSIECKVRGRLVALRNRGLVWRDADQGWALTPAGDDRVFDFELSGLA